MQTVELLQRADVRLENVARLMEQIRHELEFYRERDRDYRA
jgi:hypothetical protein